MDTTTIMDTTITIMDTITIMCIMTVGTIVILAIIEQCCYFSPPWTAAHPPESLKDDKPSSKVNNGCAYLPSSSAIRRSGQEDAPT